MEYSCGKSITSMQIQEPRKWGPCGKLSYFLRKHQIYLSLLLMIFITLVVALASSRFLQLCENVEELYKMNSRELEYLSNINWTSQFIPTRYSTPNDKLANLIASRSSGYWILASESAQLVSIEKQGCGDNCSSKVYLNGTQLNEIGRFLDDCFIDISCNLSGWRVTKGDSLVCNPIVHMEKSAFQFCIDNNKQINSAIVNTYILYFDVLNLLYAAQDIFTDSN